VLGGGGGQFTYGNRWTDVDLLPNFMSDLIEGDIEGDGFRDLVLDIGAGPGGVTGVGWLQGFGDGTFGSLHSLAVPNTAGNVSGLVIVDLAGEGHGKLLFTSDAPTGTGASQLGLYQFNATTGAIQLLLQDGAPVFPLAADFNHDGAQDLVGTNPFKPHGIDLFLNGCPP